MPLRILLNFCTIQNVTKTILRNYAHAKQNMKVTVVGAGGHVGQYTSVLLKTCPLIDELTVFDSEGVSGFGKELSHLGSRCKTEGFSGMDQARCALEGSRVVVITAAFRGTSHLSLNKMFKRNANIVHQTAQNCAVFCPKAVFVIATHPINSMVPLFKEVLKQNGIEDPKTTLGVTGINPIRANTIIGQFFKIPACSVDVPVVGGHCAESIVPLLSQAKPCNKFTEVELEALTAKIKLAGGKIVKAKHRECDYLSCAHATSKLAISVVKGLLGLGNIIETAYVRSEAYAGAKFFSSPLLLGKHGVETIFNLPTITSFEKCQLRRAIPFISGEIERGEKFAGGNYFPECDPCKKPGICPPPWCENKDYQL